MKRIEINEIAQFERQLEIDSEKESRFHVQRVPSLSTSALVHTRLARTHSERESRLLRLSASEHLLCSIAHLSPSRLVHLSLLLPEELASKYWRF